MAKSGKNKARNQTRGSRRGIDDAPWFVSNKDKRRKKNKQAAKSRKANRGR